MLQDVWYFAQAETVKYNQIIRISKGEKKKKKLHDMQTILVFDIHLSPNPSLGLWSMDHSHE